MVLNKLTLLTATSLIALGACTQQEVVQYDEITVDTPTGKYDKYPVDDGTTTTQTGSESSTASGDELKVEDLEDPNPSSSSSPRSSRWPRSSWWPQDDSALDVETSGLDKVEVEGGGD